jgi:hypothetical protein
MLSQPEIYSRLVNELETVVTDPSSLPSWASLERLPYFISLLQNTNSFNLLTLSQRCDS